MFQGSLVALVTPFQEDGSVDIEAFRRLISRHVELGTDGLVILGSTGEASTISADEQKLLIKAALEEADKRIPILVGTGGNDTRAVVEKTLWAQKAGADGALIVVPYYNKPTFEGCFAHFQKVSECNFPTVIYHHPGRTGLKFSPKQLADLCRIPNIVGLKDCSADIGLAIEFLHLSSVPLLAGDDPLALPLIASGASGIISVLGNLIPKEWTFFIKTALAGDPKAKALYKTMEPLCNALALETNPQCIKYAMSLSGLCKPQLRLPLLIPQEKTQKEIEKATKIFMEEHALGPLFT